MKKPYLFIFATLLLLVSYAGVHAYSIGIGSGNKLQIGSGNNVQVGQLSASNIGMNFGHANTTAGDWSIAQVTTAADNLYTAGFRNIRLDFPNYTATNTSTGSFTYLMYKARIFKTEHSDYHIICGVGAGSGGISSALEAKWMDGVRRDATATSSVYSYCDEYWVGNEEEIHHDGSITDAQVRSDLQTIAANVKADGYAGTVGYDEVGTLGGIAMWTNNANIGSIDKLCFNVYGQSTSGINQFTTTVFGVSFQSLVQSIQAVFPNACLGEWNVTGTTATWGDFLTRFTDNDFGNAVAIMLQVLRNINVPMAYYFTYTSDGNDGVTSDYWAAKLQGGTCSARYYVLAHALGNDNPPC